MQNDNEVKVVIYVPKNKLREKGLDGCTVDLTFCDRKLYQAVLTDGRHEEEISFDDGMPYLWNPIDDEPYEDYECGNCGYVATNRMAEEYKYCPNCGEKMREVDADAETDGSRD